MPADPLYSWGYELGKDAMTQRLKWRFKNYQHLHLDVRGAWRRDPGQMYDPGGCNLTFMCLYLMYPRFLDHAWFLSHCSFMPGVQHFEQEIPAQMQPFWRRWPKDPVWMESVVFAIVSVQWHRNVFPDVDLCFSVTCSKGRHRCQTGFNVGCCSHLGTGDLAVGTC